MTIHDMNASDIVAFFSGNDAFFSDNDAFEPDVNLGPISRRFVILKFGFNVKCQPTVLRTFTQRTRRRLGR